MSDQRCDAFNLLLIPLSAVVACCVWLLPTGQSLMVEEGLLYVLTVFAICAHAHYGTCVVTINLIYPIITAIMNLFTFW